MNQKDKTSRSLVSLSLFHKVLGPGYNTVYLQESFKRNQCHPQRLCKGVVRVQLLQALSSNDIVVISSGV